jgi:Arc/MetJ family transcription regulator
MKRLALAAGIVLAPPCTTANSAIACRAASPIQDTGSALPYSHISGMASHMKTTLNIDDTVMAELKREAARQGRTMSELVETALRLLLRSPRKRTQIPDLPTFRSGGTMVDIADREALYQAMEGR